MGQWILIDLQEAISYERCRYSIYAIASIRGMRMDLEQFWQHVKPFLRG